MTYKFVWKDAVHGQVVIEAKNGIEAEKIFRDMSLEQRLNASSVSVETDTLEIKFVDAGLGDIHTAEEWESEFKHIT